VKELIEFLKKFRWEIVLELFLILIFFTTRLVNLTILPIFADEAIYVRWSQIMRNEPTLRFLPLSDGKTPLFMWVLIPLLKFFQDPLIAGRLISILSGFGTLVGIFVLARYLRGARVALLASFLYIISPYMLFFDRMALVDSFLNFWGVWSLFLAILLVRTLRLDVAMFLGFVLAGSVLTKPSGWFFLYLLPLTLILFDFSAKGGSASGRKKLITLRLAKLVGLWAVSALFAFLGYNALRLGPNFQMIAARNRDYVFSLQEVLTHPWDPFKARIVEFFGWFGTLFTWPIFLIALAGIVFAIFKKQRELIFIFLWALLPFLVQAEIAKDISARYLIFSATPLLFLAANFCDQIFDFGKKKFGRVLTPIILILISILPAIFIFQLLSNPQKAPLPRKERSGYLEEWTSGYGLREVADYLKIEAQERKVMVGTEGVFGTLPDGLQIYLEGVPNVTVIGIGIPVGGPTQPLINSLVDSEVYLVANSSRVTFEESPQLELLKSFPKPQKPDGSRESLLLFRVKEVE
jgi:4-amino-4-deoxy-L-arabinose transferase-like glycosyltransferase